MTEYGYEKKSWETLMLLSSILLDRNGRLIAEGVHKVAHQAENSAVTPVIVEVSHVEPTSCMTIH